MMKKIIKFLCTPWYKWQEYKATKKRMDELRKRDPFIYK